MTVSRPKAWMVLGTGSGVGKSFIAAGLCRILSDRGVRVAPFKAQNMSNNSFVTRDGKEMGRAQAVQAECARVEPSVHMNPVLLKPAADNESQVIIQGEVAGSMRAQEYYGMRKKIGSAIQESYDELSRQYDVLVIEGAGSPAEINLKEFDLANCRVAEMADARCLLVGDIDRGGVFAWLWGTIALLGEHEQARIDGLIINKFRGDFKLLEPGIGMLENLCGKKVLGTLPYDLNLWIEEEDSVDGRGGPACLPSGRTQRPAPTILDIAVLFFPRISNATDFQILAQEPDVTLRMVRCPEELGSPDLLILPGTKATISDLQHLKTRGFVKKIQDYVQAEGRVMGICGGYQMLGEFIEDPESVESGTSREAGLGFLPIRTQFASEKILRRVRGRMITEIFGRFVKGEITGYEIHMGTSSLTHDAKPLLEIRAEESNEPWRADGTADCTSRIFGTYLHGIFDAPGFRSSFLDALAQSAGKKRARSAEISRSISLVKDQNYDKLAQLLRENLDLNFLESCSKFSSHSV